MDIFLLDFKRCAEGVVSWWAVENRRVFFWRLGTRVLFDDDTLRLYKFEFGFLPSRKTTSLLFRDSWNFFFRSLVRGDLFVRLLKLDAMRNLWGLSARVGNI